MAGGVPLAIDAALRLVAARQHALQHHGAATTYRPPPRPSPPTALEPRAALGQIADDLAIAHDQGGHVGVAEERLNRIGDAAARTLAAVGPRAAGTADALIEANGTVGDDRDGAAIIANATAGCQAPCVATGALAGLAEVRADRAVRQV